MAYEFISSIEEKQKYESQNSFDEFYDEKLNIKKKQSILKKKNMVQQCSGADKATASASISLEHKPGTSTGSNKKTTTKRNVKVYGNRKPKQKRNQNIKSKADMRSNGQETSGIIDVMKKRQTGINPDRGHPKCKKLYSNKRVKDISMVYNLQLNPRKMKTISEKFGSETGYPSGTIGFLIVLFASNEVRTCAGQYVTANIVITAVSCVMKHDSKNCPEKDIKEVYFLDEYQNGTYSAINCGQKIYYNLQLGSLKTETGLAFVKMYNTNSQKSFMKVSILKPNKEYKLHSLSYKKNDDGQCSISSTYKDHFVLKCGHELRCDKADQLNCAGTSLFTIDKNLVVGIVLPNLDAKRTSGPLEMVSYWFTEQDLQLVNRITATQPKTKVDQKINQAEIWFYADIKSSNKCNVQNIVSDKKLQIIKNNKRTGSKKIPVEKNVGLLKILYQSGEEQLQQFKILTESDMQTTPTLTTNYFQQKKFPELQKMPPSYLNPLIQTDAILTRYCQAQFIGSRRLLISSAECVISVHDKIKYIHFEQRSKNGDIEYYCITRIYYKFPWKKEYADYTSLDKSVVLLVTSKENIHGSYFYLEHNKHSEQTKTSTVELNREKNLITGSCQAFDAKIHGQAGFKTDVLSFFPASTKNTLQTNGQQIGSKPSRQADNLSARHLSGCDDRSEIKGISSCFGDYTGLNITRSICKGAAILKHGSSVLVGVVTAVTTNFERTKLHLNRENVFSKEIQAFIPKLAKILDHQIPKHLPGNIALKKTMLQL